MWTDEVLERAETLASNRTGTLTQVIDVYGVDQAQVALDTTRGIPQDTERAREWIDAYVLKALNLQGYTTKAQIMKAGAGSILTSKELNRRKRIREGKRVRTYNGRKSVNLKPILTAYIPELCKRYNLTYKQPTAGQTEKYSLTKKAWIITRKEEAPETAPTIADGGADHNKG